MSIKWNELLTNNEYNKIKKEKDFMYDMIIGELNRISVSDDFEEKQNLLHCLKTNIQKYYMLSVKCTEIILKYDISD